MKTQTRRKKYKYSKHSNKPLKNVIIFYKIIKNFCMILNRLKRRWHPLNNAEIEMINQSFEGYHEVNIKENNRWVNKGTSYWIS